jgi:hypothetical protein
MTQPATSTRYAIGDSLKAYVLYQFDTAGRALGAGTKLPLRLKDVRKSTRRIRAALALCGARLGTGARAIESELKALSDRFSEVRDAHVVVDTLVVASRSLKDEEQRAVFRRLHKAMDANYRKVLNQLVDEDPAFVLQRAHLRSLRDDVALLPWNGVTQGDVESSLLLAAQRVTRIAEKAARADDARIRHMWRRRLRRLRYQLRLARRELGWHIGSPEDWSWPDPDSQPEVVLPDAPKNLGSLIAMLGAEQDLRVVSKALRATRRLKDDDRARVIKRVRKTICVEST